MWKRNSSSIRIIASYDLEIHAWLNTFIEQWQGRKSKIAKSHQNTAINEKTPSMERRACQKNQSCCLIPRLYWPKMRHNLRRTCRVYPLSTVDINAPGTEVRHCRDKGQAQTRHKHGVNVVLDRLARTRHKFLSPLTPPPPLLQNQGDLCSFLITWTPLSCGKCTPPPLDLGNW